MIERIQSSDGQALFPRSAVRSDRIKWLLAGIMAVIAVLGVAFVCSNRRGPLAPTEIFAGITYGCKQLDTTGEGSGLVQWVIVDLAAPGIELYVTPLDPDAVAGGWQYHLRRIGDVVDKERLAVAINATLIESNSGWWPRMAGDLARGGETLVAEHVVSHLSVHTYFLWFDEQLTPHLRPSNPPTAAELNQAKWGIGGQGVGLWDGKVRPGTAERPILALLWPSTGSGNYCFWRSAKISRPASCLKSLPI